MPKKASRLPPLLLGAGFGAVFGFLCGLKMASDGPNTYHPVSIYSEENTIKHEAKMHVSSLGIWNYDRTAANHDTFQTEIDLLMYPPVILVFVLCTVAGAMIMRYVDRLWRGEFRRLETVV